jgi:HAD superfamily hydrolase (TIGR01484 family)
MKPITELDATTARRLSGIAFDIDDTLTRGGRLEPEAYQAITRLASAGLLLIAATGRPHGWAFVTAHLWPLAAAVAENGACWVRAEPDRPVLQGFFESADTRAMDRERLEAVFHIVQSQMPQIRLTDDMALRRVDMTFAGPGGRRLHDAEVEQLVSILHEQGARSLVSSIQVHATFSQADKARGIVAAVRDTLRQEITGRRDEWLFIGDSGNDAAAFDYFPVSAGVANVREFLDRIPTPPAYVSRQDRGRGFAEIADHILALRGNGT